MFPHENARNRFARFQSIADLVAFGGTASPGEVATIAALVPGVAHPAVAWALRIGRLPADDPDVRDAVHLAAALPGSQAFFPATAVMLADALRGGAAPLADYHDAHEEAYSAAPAPLRAALFNGFRVAMAEGIAALGRPVPLGLRATRGDQEVRAALERVPGKAALILLDACAGGPGGAAEALWRERAEEICAAPPLADAARHLYETRDGWDPYRDWSDARIAAEGVALPFEAS